MSVPVLATHRMHFSYIVAGLTHTLNLFCSASGTGTAALLNYLAGGTLTPQEGSDATAAGVAPFFASADFGGWAWALQKYVSGTWVTENSGSSSLTGTAAVVTVKASQMTIVLRDISNHFAKVVLLEGYFTPSYHFVSASALSGDIETVYNTFSKTSGSDPDRPALWMVSRGDNKLMDEPLVGLTGDLNDRVRRSRGLV